MAARLSIFQLTTATALGWALVAAPCWSFELTKKQVTVPAPVPTGPIEFPQIPAVTPKTKTALPATPGFRAEPRTPDEISAYLKTMRGLIDRYNSVVGSLLLKPGSTMYISPDAESLAAANAQTQQLSEEIKSVVPPKEIAAAHNSLADSMSSVEEFLAAGGNNFAAIPRALSLATTIQNTMGSYHSSVQDLIRKHGLSMSLDPFAGEDPAKREQASEQASQLRDQLTGGTIGGIAGSIGAGKAGGGGLLDMAKMFSGSGSALGGAGNSGPGSGALGGSSNGLDMQQLGQILQTLTGGLGGAAGSTGSTFGSGGSFGPSGSFSPGGSFGAGGTFGSGGSFGSSGGNSGLGGMLQQLGGGSGNMNNLLQQLGGGSGTSSGGAGAGADLDLP